LRLWDATTGQLLRTFVGHTDQVRAAAVYAEGKRFLSASFDGTVRLWDFLDTKPVALLGFALGRLRCLALSPEGKVFLAAGEGQALPFPLAAPTGQVRSGTSL